MTTLRMKSSRTKKDRKDSRFRAKTSKGLDIGWIRDKLGASSSFPVTTAPDGAFGTAALALEVQARLLSTGGRPSDPEARIRRLVPMKKSVWLTLRKEAKAASTSRRRVSPGQLAAILLEKSLVALRGEGV